MLIYLQVPLKYKTGSQCFGKYICLYPQVKRQISTNSDKTWSWWHEFC